MKKSKYTLKQISRDSIAIREKNAIRGFLIREPGSNRWSGGVMGVISLQLICPYDISNEEFLAAVGKQLP